MSKPVHLFVSSSPELQVEREIIGQVVATLPLTIGWRIDHTPMLNRSGEGSPVQCDAYALVLGHDFAAPMGAELRLATTVGRVPLAFRKKTSYSPSAQDAVRQLEIRWHTFATAEEFRSLFARELIQAIVQQATQLGLELDEVERLLERIQASSDSSEETPAAGRRQSDAGKSGVILGREIWETDR